MPRERVCGGQGGRLSPARQSPLRSSDVVHSKYRPLASLFHIVVTKGPSSEKASDPEFDRALGERMRIGTEEVGSSQRVPARSRTAAGSFRADESEVSRLGLQYAVTHGLSWLAAACPKPTFFARDSTIASVTVAPVRICDVITG